MKSILLKTFIVFFVLALSGGIIFEAYRFEKINRTLVAQSAEKEQALLVATKHSDELSGSLKQKDTYITFLEGENAELTKTLAEEKGKTTVFEEQVSIIGKTISEIQKIQNTDAELLKKYSKVYFLNENYKPAELAPIPLEFLVNQKAPLEINAKVAPFLNAMITASAATGSPLRVISAFRSFDDQKSLKSNYRITYGAGANKFSADQGYSEHQLGTTVDLSNEKLALGYTQMGSTNSFLWLTAHAHEYGFTLSYPKGNSAYQYEPWHWRFVGVALATDLHNRNMYFYDMGQREIETYIGKLFDPI